MTKEGVLITGCGGMLGNAIYPYFSARYDKLRATDKDLNEPWLEHLDVRDTAALRRHFTTLQPRLVLHLAACTDLEYCETHRDDASNTNHRATGEIAALCEEFGATLVYISTAGVFDGAKLGFYTEADEPNPLMHYGRTKLDGEKLAAARCQRLFTVRAGWMVGGGRKDHKFVYHILSQVTDGATVIRAVTDRWGTPTYTHDFALNLFELLATRRYGTYHMVCEGSGNRFDVARAILDITGHRDIELVPVDSSYFAERFFAPRPVSEMMINANLTALGINRMRPWRAALEDYILREFPDAVVGEPDRKFARRKHADAARRDATSKGDALR